MASRLSEDTLRSVYDAGTDGLLIQSDHSLALLSPESLDLDALLTSEDPESALQAVAPQPLYNALVRRGPEDCLEVLRIMSPEQVQRVIDYDVWREDRLIPANMMRWMNLFKELGPEHLYRRFRDLDEEYQTALLGPWIQLFDEEEFEKLSDVEQDELHKLPSGTQYYKVRSEDPRVHQFVEDLVEASLGQDVAYAQSLLAHAAFLPPNESEAEIARFRKARIEEDGFVSYEESLAAFRPLNLEELRFRHGLAPKPDDEAMIVTTPRADSVPFLLRAVQEASRSWSQEQIQALTQGFAFLANSLCAVAKVGTDDVAGVRRILQHAHALAGLGLELLANGDATAAVSVLATEHPKTLFRAGITIVDGLAEATFRSLGASGVSACSEAIKLLRLDRRGALIATLDRELLPVLGFERSEAIKGLCNRFPLQPVGTSSESAAGSAPRIIFKPIAALADLAALATRLDGIVGVAQIASLAREGGERPLKDVDRQIATALARVLSGGEFGDAPLTRDEAQKVIDLPQSAAQSLAADFLTGVEGTLRTSLLTDDRGWSVSRAAGLAAGDPVQPALGELSDVMLRLAACREMARHAGSAALASLVELEGHSGIESGRTEGTHRGDH